MELEAVSPDGNLNFKNVEWAALSRYLKHQKECITNISIHLAFHQNDRLAGCKRSVIVMGNVIDTIPTELVLRKTNAEAIPCECFSHHGMRSEAHSTQLRDKMMSTGSFMRRLKSCQIQAHHYNGEISSRSGGIQSISTEISNNSMHDYLGRDLYCHDLGFPGGTEQW